MGASFVAVNAAAAETAGTTTSAGTAAITPTLPTGSASGDRVFVYQSHSCATGSAATPANWTALYKDVVVGTGAVAASSGQRFASCYYRDYDGIWTMPSFALASVTQNSHAIGAVTLRKAGGDAWGTPFISAVSTDFGGTVDTSYSTTSAAFTTYNGELLTAHVTTNDNVTATTGAMTGTGSFTPGTVTERDDGGTATGNDVSIKLHTASPSANSAGTITHTMTLSAASEGGTAYVAQTAAPANPVIATFTDDFLTSTQWTLRNATIAGGQLTITTSGAGNSDATTTGVGQFTLASSQIVFNIANMVVSGEQSIFYLIDTPQSNAFSFYKFTDGNLYSCERSHGVDSNANPVAWNATNHKYLRIRESGGTVFFETSPTGLGAWTVQRSKVWAVASISSFSVLISTVTGAGASTLTVDAVNIITGRPASINRAPIIRSSLY